MSDMPQRHTKLQPMKCILCPKIIPRNGFGYSAHMKMHVRNGEASMDYNEQYQCYEFRAITAMIDTAATLGAPERK